MLGLNIVTKIMGPENLNILSVGQISHVPWYKLYDITLKDSFGKYYLKILICIICWIYYLNNVKWRPSMEARLIHWIHDIEKQYNIGFYVCRTILGGASSIVS